MVGTPDVVQPWMPRAARDRRCVALPREHRGWTEAPRMCRSRCIGILGRALLSRARGSTPVGAAVEAARRGGRRAADEVPLAELHAELAQRAELRGRLDALGDHVERQLAREVFDDADEARLAPLPREPVDERLADLQR